MIIFGDVRDKIKEIDNNSVRLLITSPPYFQCRNYGKTKQIGLEKTPEEYIQKLVNIFNLAKPKLTEDGNLFINIGDKYNKDKSLLLIPTNFAEEMKKNGWILRNVIIWFKPNYQPSPVVDRLTNTYEYIFHFTKNKKYYYDLDSIRIPNKSDPDSGIKVFNRFKEKIINSKYLSENEKTNALNELDKLLNENKINNDARLKIRGKNKSLFGGDSNLSGRAKELETKGYCFHCNNPKGKNPGDLLSVNIKAFHGLHEAIFPEELVEPLIKVGSAEGDYVLDIFAGTGTTCRVADRMGRISLGIELNEEYVVTQ